MQSCEADHVGFPAKTQSRDDISLCRNIGNCITGEGTKYWSFRRKSNNAESLYINPVKKNQTNSIKKTHLNLTTCEGATQKAKSHVSTSAQQQSGFIRKLEENISDTEAEITGNVQRRVCFDNWIHSGALYPPHTSPWGRQTDVQEICVTWTAHVQQWEFSQLFAQRPWDPKGCCSFTEWVPVCSASWLQVVL